MITKKMGPIFGFLMLILLILSSPHFYFQIEYRGILWSAITFISIVVIYIMWSKRSLNINIFFLLLLFFYSYCDLIYRDNILGSFSWFSSIFVFCAINGLDNEVLKKSFLLLIKSLKLLLSIAILTHIFYILKYGFHWNGQVHSQLMSNYYGMLIIPYLDIRMLKPTAFLIQSSLIPAYICLPFAIYFCIKTRYSFSDLIFFIFILISFGGGGYFAIIIAVIIYFIPVICTYKISKYFIFLTLVLFIFCGNFFPGGDDPLSKIYLYTNDNYFNERFYSGLMRLNIIGEQFNNLLHRTGAPIDTSISDFGSAILTAGDRAGVLGVILIYFLYRQVFIKLSPFFISDLFKSLRPNIRFGLCLLGSVIIQSFMYNDVGFSLQYGLIMIALIPKFLDLITPGINNTNQ